MLMGLSLSRLWPPWCDRCKEERLTPSSDTSRCDEGRRGLYGHNNGVARYVTSISSALAPDVAFAYMADFTHVHEWDPSVSRSERVDESTFDLTASFGGRDVQLRYRIVEQDPPRRVVLE